MTRNQSQRSFREERAQIKSIFEQVNDVKIRKSPVEMVPTQQLVPDNEASIYSASPKDSQLSFHSMSDCVSNQSLERINLEDVSPHDASSDSDRAFPNLSDYLAMHQF